MGAIKQVSWVTVFTVLFLASFQALSFSLVQMLLSSCKAGIFILILSILWASLFDFLIYLWIHSQLSPSLIIRIDGSHTCPLSWRIKWAWKGGDNWKAIFYPKETAVVSKTHLPWVWSCVVVCLHELCICFQICIDIALIYANTTKGTECVPTNYFLKIWPFKFKESIMVFFTVRKRHLWKPSYSFLSTFVALFSLTKYTLGELHQTAGIFLVWSKKFPFWGIFPFLPALMPAAVFTDCNTYFYWPLFL